MCRARCEVPGHNQVQLTQTLIVLLQRTQWLLLFQILEGAAGPTLASPTDPPDFSDLLVCIHPPVLVPVVSMTGQDVDGLIHVRGHVVLVNAHVVGRVPELTSGNQL